MLCGNDKQAASSNTIVIAAIGKLFNLDMTLAILGYYLDFFRCNIQNLEEVPPICPKRMK